MKESIGRVLVIGAGLAGAAVAWAATRVSYAVTLVSPVRPASEADSHAPGIVFGLGPPGSMLDWIDMSGQTMASHVRLREVGRSALVEALLSAERESDLEYVEHRIDWHGEATTDLCDRDVDGLAARLAQTGYRVQRAGRSLIGEDAMVSSRKLTLELLRQARGRRADLRLGSEVKGSRSVSVDMVAAEIDGEEELFEKIYWAGSRPIGGSAAEPRVVLHQRNGAGERPLPGIVQSADGEIVLFPARGRRASTALRRVGRTSVGGRIAWRELPGEWRAWVGPTQHQLLSESLARPASVVPDSDDRVTCVAGLSSWPVASVLGASVEMVGAGPHRDVSG